MCLMYMKNKVALISSAVGVAAFIGGFFAGRASKKDPSVKGALVVTNSKQDLDLYLMFYTIIQDMCSDEYVILKVVKQKNTDA